MSSQNTVTVGISGGEAEFASSQKFGKSHKRLIDSNFSTLKMAG